MGVIVLGEEGHPLEAARLYISLSDKEKICSERRAVPENGCDGLVKVHWRADHNGTCANESRSMRRRGFSLMWREEE